MCVCAPIQQHNAKSFQFYVCIHCSGAVCISLHNIFLVLFGCIRLQTPIFVRMRLHNYTRIRRNKITFNRQQTRMQLPIISILPLFVLRCRSLAQPTASQRERADAQLNVYDAR